MNAIIELLRSYIPVAQQSWFTDVLAITLGSFICWLVWKLIYTRLELLSSKTKTRWDDVFIVALKTPISTMIWCWPAISSTGLIIQTYIDRDLDWLGSLQTLLVIFIMTWITFRLVHNIEEEFANKKKYDVTTLQAIAKVARLFFAILGVLTVMQSFGVSLSGLLTFGGVGGLIAGLAAKDLLSNFFGGVMVYFDRPFKVGDWIRSPDRSIEGTVERIGWRMTVIRTFDKRPLYVPNSVFSSIVVENPSRMTNRRIFETIGVRYCDHQSLQLIIDEVKTMLKIHPDIDASQTLIVNFNSFGPSSLDFFVYTFTKTVNWERYHVVKQAVLLDILAIIHKHDADVAFPTQTLKVEQITDPQ
ncbi:mechanosensitive ion channel family protein [Vibrio sp. SCSIO 43136]|uniref:mechanosensitive ion channel family protein n=1 Tax=Vibrio sp. SCSIO 43136 TaxID=2819101 RepID=UPI0020757141|nr:mechanosensitive ion channel family protein [Vibrio sp. SCSIO 43136]USD66780.1 mechanosensitive ion channel family protein [Vibrio sp. SCSIO 43136]